ncbi:transposase, partial [Candidatus Thiosymbion oneisti]|uniref:transposase n=1 Tax=Candidatus Thiosymbion oneisti TaxID=589554 RepID=UPI0034E24488
HGKSYKQGQARSQAALLPPRVEAYVRETNRVRAIDAAVDTLDLPALGFANAGGELAPGQLAFDPAALLKRALYGYLNRVHSSRLIWLLEGLVPCSRTIAEFRRVNARG